MATAIAIAHFCPETGLTLSCHKRNPFLSHHLHFSSASLSHAVFSRGYLSTEMFRRPKIFTPLFVRPKDMLQTPQRERD
ncbi:hypothetical protein S83_026421 [Arachis hypogaea]